jgi:predicted ferric reductase
MVLDTIITIVIIIITIIMRHKYDQEAENVLKQYNTNTVYFECKSKDDTSHNRGNWNHFKIAQRKHLMNIHRQHELN